MPKEYPIFEHWYQTLNWILSTLEHFPKNARFSVASRIADMALDSLESIIEAIYTKNRGTLLDNLNLQLEKQRVLFRLAFERRYISASQYEFIAKALDETGKMAGGWKKASHEAHRPSV